MPNITEPDKEVVAGGRQPRGDTTVKPVWEVIDEVMSEVPETVLNRLPTDGAERHDHYLSGTHEKASPES